jgi:MOSC domain-containing protein YiiM
MGSGAEEPKPEAYGPEGDSARHVSFDELVARVRALPLPPRESGRVHLIVRRHADGVRETLDCARLTAEGGVPGDRWSRKLPVNPDAQLTVMRRDIAEVIANGQPLTTFGDNLFVDLDISAENLPVGTRAWFGDALLEVTPKPHNGCLKFKGRFGQDALEFVQAKPTRDQNYRGIYFRVVEPGDARVGASISVIRSA